MSSIDDMMNGLFDEVISKKGLSKEEIKNLDRDISRILIGSRSSYEAKDKVEEYLSKKQLNFAINDCVIHPEDQYWSMDVKIIQGPGLDPVIIECKVVLRKDNTRGSVDEGMGGFGGLFN